MIFLTIHPRKQFQGKESYVIIVRFSGYEDMVIHLVANILFLYGKNNAYVHVICFYCRHRRVVNLLCRRISLIICLMCLYWNVIITNRAPLFYLTICIQ